MRLRMIMWRRTGRRSKGKIGKDSLNNQFEEIILW